MSQPPVRSPALAELERKGIPYRLFIHKAPITSLDQAAAERGQDPEQVVRSILFRLSQGEFFLALVAGPQQVNWRGLRRTFNQSRLTMASPEEVERITGYKPGTVSPFGLPEPLPVIADPNVFAPKEISLGSGVRGVAIIMTTADLRVALGKVSILPLVEPEG
jgi:Cys-tRNA(Pro) deacylase